MRKRSVSRERMRATKPPLLPVVVVLPPVNGQRMIYTTALGCRIIPVLVRNFGKN
jgi:hypothetical protein